MTFRIEYKDSAYYFANEVLFRQACNFLTEYITTGNANGYMMMQMSDAVIQHVSSNSKPMVVKCRFTGNNDSLVEDIEYYYSRFIHE